MRATRSFIHPLPPPPRPRLDVELTSVCTALYEQSNKVPDRGGNFCVICWGVRRQTRQTDRQTRQDTTSTTPTITTSSSAIPDSRCLGCTDSTTVEHRPLDSAAAAVGELSLSTGIYRTAADDLTRTHESLPDTLTNQDSRPPAVVSSAQLSSAQISPSQAPLSPDQGRPACSCSLSIGPPAMSLYNMPPPAAPQPSSSLSGESPLALAPTVGDLDSADLFGSGTTNGGGPGHANGHGHGHGSGSGSANGNSNSSGTVTPSAHDQGSQSAAAGPAVPAACLACVSSPIPLLLGPFFLLVCGLLSFSPPGVHPVPAGRGYCLPSSRVGFIGLTRTHAVSAITA